MRLGWISLLILVIATAAAQAAIPTPPLADDPSLVLRLSFDKVIAEHDSFETGWDGWSDSIATSESRSTSWSSDGSYSVLITYGEIWKTFSTPVDRLTFDYNIASGATLNVLADGSTIWSLSGPASGTATLSELNATQINFEVPTDGYNVYIDNIYIYSKAADDSGNGNDGTVYGATSVEGRYGRALSFDGVDDYIGFSSPIFNLPTQITFAAWIKYDELKDRNQVIFYHNEKGFFTVHIDKNGKLGANVRDESGQWFGGSAPTILEAGKWYFVCIVWDGQTGYIKYYVNGQLVGTKSYPAGSPIFAGSTGVLPLIGAYGVGTLINFFDGIIDEVRIYNRSLSDSEIQQMYEALRVKFYDESTGEKIAANATVLNANYSITLQTDEVTKEAVLFYQQINNSDTSLNLQVTDSEYYTRIVSVSTPSESTFYLLPKTASDVVLETFYIYDPMNKYPDKTKAKLVIKKYAFGKLIKITEMKFDREGYARVYLQLGNTYTMEIYYNDSIIYTTDFQADPAGYRITIDNIVNPQTQLNPYTRTKIKVVAGTSPIPGAKVEIYYQNEKIVSTTTDYKGEASFNLEYAKKYTVIVTYQDKTVQREIYPSESEYKLYINLIEPTGERTVTITVKDELSGVAVRYARVDIYSSDFHASGYTDENGQVTLQAPSTNFTVVAYSDDYNMPARQIIADGNTTIYLASNAVAQQIQIIDLTGKYNKPLVTIQKTLGNSKIVIYKAYTEDDNTLNVYLLKSYPYEIVLYNGQETRYTGYHYPSKTGTIKITVGEIKLRPSVALFRSKVVYDLGFNAQTGEVYGYYLDNEGKTAWVNYTVWNWNKTQILYTYNDTPHSPVTFAWPYNESSVIVEMRAMRDGYEFREMRVVSIGKPSIPMFNLQGEDKQYELILTNGASAILLIFIGGLFGAADSRKGALIVCMIAWMFYLFGWLHISVPILTTATTLAVLGLFGNRNVY